MRDHIMLFVPGRLCVFGEHSDWAGGHRIQNEEVEKGYAIVAPTNQGNYAIARRLDDNVLKVKSSLGNVLEIPLEEKVLLEKAEKGGFFSYIAGVSHHVVTNYHNILGLEIDNYKTDLPVKKGLSSSASICVLVARAFNQIYNLGWTTKREMEIAYFGEITTPSRCGRLDQACAFSNPVLMTFDSHKVDVNEIRAGNPLHFVIVDLKAGKDTKKILAELSKGFPFPTNPFEEGKHKYLGEINKRIVHSAMDAIKKGDAKETGLLMKEAQENFDKYLAPACPSELTAPKLHQTLEYPKIQDLIYGGKGIGSQGDGSAQFIARDEKCQKKLIEILNSCELNVGALPLTIK